MDAQDLHLGFTETLNLQSIFQGQPLGRWRGHQSTEEFLVIYTLGQEAEIDAALIRQPCSLSSRAGPEGRESFDATGQCAECTEGGKVTDLSVTQHLVPHTMAWISICVAARNFHYKFLCGPQSVASSVAECGLILRSRIQGLEDQAAHLRSLDLSSPGTHCASASNSEMRERGMQEQYQNHGESGIHDEATRAEAKCLVSNRFTIQAFYD